MITLNPLFRDGAVFQQKKPIPVWGRAIAGNRLKAEFAGVEANTKAAAGGKFMLRLPSVDAGGPFELKITDLDSGETVLIKDILVGEVWLASGQSNMEYTLGSDWVPAIDETLHVSESVNRIQEKEYCDTIPDPSKLRFITLDKRATGLEEETFIGEWKYMNSENAPLASAVAAWFARFIQEKINVPVGLVISAWGGTIAEAWTSRAGLLSNPETAPMVSDADKIFNEEECWNRLGNLAVQIPAEKCLDPGNEGFGKGWAEPDFDDSEWKTMRIPGSWIVQKISGNGALWVRQEIEIPAEWAGKDIVLNMGGIDKLDTTYFNGTEVGRTGKDFETKYWNQKRKYTIPGNLVKAGRNVLAVRAYSFMLDGSFLGSSKNYYIQLEGSEERIFFAGEWKANAELDLGVLSPGALLPGPGNANTPGILFNSMIRPLLPFAIRGAIWYQGESNAHSIFESLSYTEKLSTMIRDWRYHWGQGDFPFIQVQLANYSPGIDPEFVRDSRWAVLRESQRLVCENLPQVSMCTAVDIGELTDIHPQDKKTVGIRMAANALHHVYGYESIVPFGPLYQSYAVEGNSIRISFRYAEGMKIREDLLQSFYIAGKDRVFHPATAAKVEGNTILVNSEKVSNPYAVRYGWSDAAISTVYNAAGLPASPFRTDDWNLDA